MQLEETLCEPCLILDLFLFILDFSFTRLFNTHEDFMRWSIWRVGHRAKLVCQLSALQNKNKVQIYIISKYTDPVAE